MLLFNEIAFTGFTLRNQAWYSLLGHKAYTTINIISGKLKSIFRNFGAMQQIIKNCQRQPHWSTTTSGNTLRVICPLRSKKRTLRGEVFVGTQQKLLCDVSSQAPLQ